MSDYDMQMLALDTPDEHPAWKNFIEASRLGFLQSSSNDDTWKRSRDDFRADQARLRQIFATRPAVDPTLPVATFASMTYRINVGHARLLPSNFITEVTVRATDRRRGLLRRMMTADLAEAKRAGLALASLTASEGSIYGRFGFGVATRQTSVEIDTRLATFREPSQGRCELVSPQALTDLIKTIAQQALLSNRGMHEQPAVYQSLLTGSWDFDNQSPNHAQLRAIIHYDSSDTIDGFATYLFSNETESIVIQMVVSPHLAAELAMLDTIIHIDLVKKIKYAGAASPQALSLALVNPRAISTAKIRDQIWLRILDPIQALSVRGWDRDGDLIIAVTDDLGLADGTYSVAARDGKAQVVAVNAEPDISLSAETLAQLYFGEFSLAAMGDRVKATPAGLDKAEKIFAVIQQPYNNVVF